MSIQLSTLAILLGLIFAAPQIYGILNPAGFTRAARAFPRSLSWGYALVGLGAAWFIYNLKQENIADFENLKPLLMALFVAVALGACLFIKDFLATRGLAIVLLLLAQLMVESARLADTSWRLVIITWAYVWVVAGIWLTVHPWRLRDFITWNTATENRVRLLSGIRLAFGLLVLGLGFTVFRNL